MKSIVTFLTVKRLLDGGELADLFLKLVPYVTHNRNEAVEEQKGEEQNGEEQNGEGTIYLGFFFVI